MTADIERDLAPAEDKLISTYGFLKEEISFVMRYNPKFILFESTPDIGIKTLSKFLVDNKGFE